MLVLDAGNSLFGPTDLTVKTRGRIIVDTMNLMGYGAMTVGGRDLANLTLEELKAREAKADFPFLSANVTLSGSDEPLFQPYTVVKYGDRSVAILGLTGTDGDSSTVTNDGRSLILRDPAATAKRHMREIRELADIVIVLSSLGVDADVQLAEAVKDIDLIVGGRTRHILMEPLVSESNGTIIVQAGYRGEWIGTITLVVDGRGVVTSHTGHVRPLSADYADDAEMLQLLATAPRATLSSLRPRRFGPIRPVTRHSRAIFGIQLGATPLGARRSDSSEPTPVAYPSTGGTPQLDRLRAPSPRS